MAGLGGRAPRGPAAHDGEHRPVRVLLGDRSRHADPAALPDAELVDAVVGLERIAAWARARQHALLAEFARRPGDGTVRPHRVPVGEVRAWAADEIAMAPHLSPGAAMAGSATPPGSTRPCGPRGISSRPAGSTSRGPGSSPPPWPSSTTRRPRRCRPGCCRTPPARRRAGSRPRCAALAVDAEGAAERHRAAARKRRVDVFPGEDGMDTLWACVPAVDAAACFTWLTRLARGLRSSAEECTGPQGSLDARRADVAVALLTGRLQIVDPEGEPALRARPVGAERPLVCELDHVTAWQHGGSTSEDNIACLCERHHDLKEQPGWQVVLHPDRSMEWITPTGHRYLGRPVDHRVAGATVPAPPASRPAAGPQAAPVRARWSARDAFGRGDPALTNGDPPPI